MNRRTESWLTAITEAGALLAMLVGTVAVLLAFYPDKW